MDRPKKKKGLQNKGLGGATRGSLKSGSPEAKKVRAGAKASKSEEKYRRIVEEAKEGICVAKDGKLRFINPAMANLLAYPRKGLVSRPFADFVHPDDLKRVLENHFRRSKGEEAPSIYPFRLVDKDGTTKWVETKSVRIAWNGRPATLNFISNITERKRGEEALQRSEKEAQSLLQETSIMAEIGRIISSTMEIEEVYERFAAEVRKLVPFDRISIVEANLAEGKGSLIYDAGLEVPDRRSGDRFELRGSVTGLLTRTRSGLIVQGKAMEPFVRQIPAYRPIYQAGFRSMMAVPLILREQFVGTLGMNSLHPDSYSEHHLKVAESIGNHIAGAIANARLFSERKRAEAALKNSEEEARKLAQENAIIAQIGRIISSTLNIEEVYERFAEEVRKLLPFDRLAVEIIDQERGIITNTYFLGVEVPGRRPGDVMPLAGSLNEMIMRAKKPLLIPALDPEELKRQFPTLWTTFQSGLRSMLSVPLISSDQVIGVLHFRSIDPNAYSGNDIGLAESIAAQIASTIANAQLFGKRQQAESALRDSEEKYRLLVQNAKDAIFIIQDGVIKFSNLQTEKLFGYSAAELAAIPFTNHVHPADQETAGEEIAGGRETEKYPQPRSFRIRNKSGQEVWLELRSIGIEWEGKAASLNFASNITEQKKLEAQFLQSQKMEAVGRLAGGVAHDFNNLLTVINANSQLALMEMKEIDPLREKFDSIQKAGEKAANLTRQLLAFSRRQALEMKVLDLNMVLQDLEKMLRRVIGEDIELTTLLNKDLGRIKADPGQIEQAVLNLVVNARDAMPSGGKLTIETCNLNIDREYAFTHMGMKPGRYVMLSVSDNGVGMKPEIQDRIFEPFFTTKEKGKGTGLGLSTVYGAAKQSGGDISVYSELGSGTTFKIYFPQVDEPLGETGKKVTCGEMQGGHETILVVEDEEEVRKLAVGILKKYGYKVLEASDGGAAILLCEQYKAPIHLLLSDVVMPEMSGPDFAHRLKYFYPEIKVIFMSGYTDNALSQNGLLEGGGIFLQKPFSVGNLTEKVREVLDK